MGKKIKKEFHEMECPVCREFYFTAPNVDEIKNGTTFNDRQCSQCGWYYDYDQFKDPNLENKTNKLSLNEYKKWYQATIKENKNYNYFDAHMLPPKPHPCPVCGEYIFEDELCSDICPICGWEDDGDEMDPDEKPSDMQMSFNEYVEWFKEQRRKNPKFRYIDTTKDEK